MKIIETKPKINNMSRETWKYLYKRLSEIANPQLSALRNFLEAPFQMVFSEEETSQQKVYNLYMCVLRLKLDGMSTEPSPIEKTMTRGQLFLCHNPLWTKGLRPISIKTILAEYNRLKNIGAPDVIVPIINKTITKYGTIDYRRLKEIRKEHNIA